MSAKAFYHCAIGYARRALQLGPLELCDAEVVCAALNAGINLAAFKRSRELPRIRSVMGMLKGMMPDSVLEVGCGRGALLWPLLEELPGVRLAAIDREDGFIERVNDVAEGCGVPLTGHMMFAEELEFEDAFFDVVTMLEVLEHVREPFPAAREAVRVARKFVIASVPSKADNNPRHLRLFDAESLKELFKAAGATNLKVGGVSGHRILVVKVDPEATAK